MWKAELATALQNAPHGGRDAVLEQYEASTGYSRGQLYRIAREYGYSSGRKPRADKGALKCGISHGHVELAGALLHTTARENKGPIMPVNVALGILEDNGHLEPGQVSPSTLRRILRENLMSAKHLKAPDAHTDMRSLHPNHVHLFDVSVCVQYYLRGGSTRFMPGNEFYRNKPHNFDKLKRRLMRYVLVDHFSGAYYAKYYEAAGETQDNLFDFLVSAWGPKAEHGKYPFRGVPRMLMMDAGAANTSRAILAMLERMEVEVPKGMPHNPRRQGAVEVMHNIIERHIETRLRIQPASTVEELNTWAEDYVSYHNASAIHSRHGMTRTQSWLLIQREQLRELPERTLIQELYANPEEERTVSGSYAISYRGEEYSLKHLPGLYQGAKVKVVLKPFLWPVVEVMHNGKAYEARPIEHIDAKEGGFRAGAAIIGQEHKAVPMSATSRAKDSIDRMAYEEGAPTEGASARPLAGMRVFGIHADKVQHDFIGRKGVPMELQREDIGERRISIYDLFDQINASGIKMTPELNARLREEHGESVEEKAVQGIIAALQAEGEADSQADTQRQANIRIA